MKRILFSSDCNGNFQLLFTKVAQLNQKTKFDVMFLTGNVLPVQASKQFSLICKGVIQVPIPTYFITTGQMTKILNVAYPQGKQFAKNFTFLGRKGIKNVEGLNVCWVSAISDINNTCQGQYKGQFFNLSDTKELIQHSENKKIDILLTNQWPKEISKSYTETVLQSFESCSICKHSQLVSLLCYKLSPKYHLAASGKAFYRMEPFTANNQSTYTHFINVAEIIKNNLKDKYLLAVQTVPFELNPPEEQITNKVTNPFNEKKYNQMLIQKKGYDTKFIEEQKKFSFKESFKQKGDKKSSSYQNNFINQETYVYFDQVPYEARNDDIHEFLERWGSVLKLQVFKEHKGGMKSGIVKFSKVEQTKQCIEDSGKYSLYQSRIKFKAKQIENKYRHSDCWFCEKNDKFDKSLLVYRGKYCMICLDKGPVTEWHLQIVPVNHVDTIGKLQKVEVEQIEYVLKELKKYFREKGYETIMTQRYMKLSQQISHTLIQFVAMKQSRGLIHRFYQINNEQRLNFNKAEDYTKRKSQYFVKIEINGQKFIKQIYHKQKLQFEFVRKIVCELINQPGKINWRSCERSQRELQKVRVDVKQMLRECHLIVGG